MNAMLKRLLDIVGSGALLLALFPLFVVIAALIKLDSPGPVFFRQRRLGRKGRPFEICKFRTNDLQTKPEKASRRAGGSSGSDCNPLRSVDNGLKITIKRDPRLTRIGRILRRHDLDELPTLINVFKGDMSIVGPRPEVPEFLRYYTEEQKHLFSVKPGLTDPGTLTFRHEAELLVGENAEETYVREILPRKLAISLEYGKRQGFVFDVTMIFKTLVRILFATKS